MDRMARVSAVPPPSAGIRGIYRPGVPRADLNNLQACDWRATAVELSEIWPVVVTKVALCSGK
jgi:hypothetical protein